MKKIKILATVFVIFLAMGMSGVVNEGIADSQRSIELDWSDGIRMTNDSANSTRPGIVVDANNDIHVVWIDDRNANFSADIYSEIFYQWSSDSGNSWSIDEPLHPRNFSDLDRITIVRNKDTNTLHIAFRDKIPKVPVLSHTASFDNGSSWSEPKWCDSQYIFEEKVAMASSGEYVYIATKEFFGDSTYVYRLEDNNLEREWECIKFFEGDRPYDPTIATWGNDVYVVWCDNGTINYLHSNDSGKTWESTKQITTYNSSIGDRGTMALMAYKKNLYLLWDDNYEIYYKKSEDSGINWSEDIRLTNALGKSLYPDMTLDSMGNIHIVWQDDRDGNREIYYKILDKNNNITVNDTRLTNDAADSCYPKIAIDNYNYCYVVWQDNKDGNWEIYYKRYPNNDMIPPTIYHIPIPSADFNIAIPVNVTIQDNFGVSAVTLYYKGIDETNFTSLSMTLISGTVKNGIWSAIIPSQKDSIHYYIESKDSTNNVTTDLYTIQIDNTPPTIYHIPILFVNVDTSILVNVTVIDNFCVNAVTLHYKNVNDENFSSVLMNLVSGNVENGTWTANIPPQTTTGVVYYYIEAWDGINNATDSAHTITISLVSNSSVNIDLLIMMGIFAVVTVFVSLVIILIRRKW